MDDAAFAGLLASKLADPDLGETLFFGQDVGIARPPAPFGEYVRNARALVDGQLQQKLRSLAQPPASGAAAVKSWQMGFTSAMSPPAAEQAARDAVFLKIQAWRHDWLDARRWRQCLDAFDSWEGWLTLAEAWERDGRVVAANAAIAAARWLDPEAGEERILRLLGNRAVDLPARLRAQPDSIFRTREFRDRHWHAWEMKNYAHLDLPSLIAFESDENFSIRTRVYRSLGQRPHPASIQVLQEATFDPHPFARAQAARSLGWCAAPTALDRLDELKRDPDAQVRRAAEQAGQRIVGYWLYFGEWASIMADSGRLSEVIDDLLHRNLRFLAHDLLETLLDQLDARLLAVREKLADSDPLEEWGPDREYGYWFQDAAEEEAAVRGSKAGTATLRAALERGDLPTRLQALQVISWKGPGELVPVIESLVSSPEPLGWAARRALRAMNRGSMEQRSRSLL
jgi:HEAT repeat protein